MNIRSGLKVNESGFLFDPETGESYSLNEIGVLYFNWIAEGKSVSEIKNLMVAEYEVDETTYEKSFMDFESRLKNLRLLDNE